MLKTQGSIVIDQPVDKIWNFMSDWNNFSKWFVLEPGEEIKKTSEGPISLGSTIQLTGMFRGRSMVIDATVSEFEPNRKITIEYTSGSFKGSRKIYVMTPVGIEQKTQLTHTSEGQFQGLWKILEFLFRPMAMNGLKKSTKEELDKVAQGVS